MKIKKILIANRGEIAIRILRTCKELGIQTVCVHSTIDENSLHVKLADESVCIGGPKSSLSYLNIPAILSAAEITGADSIHPGFGFLSENKEFAEMCRKWELEFIGPSPECIEKMGDKILSKKIASEAGLPILKTIEVNNKSGSQLKEELRELGYPVLIKASAGGGGRGMKCIFREEELLSSIEKLKSEAMSSFKNDTLFVEKYIPRPRHIEIQILADRFGNIVHLGERDCTIQRRFQKIIEESPSPILNDEIRQQMFKAAIDLCKFVKYDSVGTVEFIFDQDDRKFYFMEMNTRIQVEHPITEQRTGIDLIAQQIKVAQNEKISFEQKDIIFTGHSMECRINAENPINGLPSPGKVLYYHRPAGIGIRVDDFIYSGYVVHPFYDSMLAKIIASAPNRDQCLDRMKRALEEAVIEGIETNKDLHLKIIRHPDFRGNNYATTFLNSYLQ